ncbi:hypothetical protein [Azospirillum canadense]|uniref:hypothetical protein n=1 Tax=Azospirillum canadense TaxID=403962 RepID=UPI0022273C21|nr:hypothetical protein [Azospirillum canadense]MCW2239900.1 hypothetical protein [Azospirillum canadense]
MTPTPPILFCLSALATLPILWPGPGDASYAAFEKTRGMPDLSGLSTRTDPQVQGHGRIIKGLYYVTEPEGPNELVAFYNACEHQLESRPFLIFDFGTQRYYFDADRDGRLDETGPGGEGIDPVPFAQREVDWSTYCYGERAG